jgi:hypothetical protein
MIFSCAFLLIRAPAKLREFHDVFNSFRTAMEWRAKKKMVESIVTEQIFWLLARDDQYRGTEKSLARPTSQCILFDG